jgi:uncharacterized protein (DUF1330 family)
MGREGPGARRFEIMEGPDRFHSFIVIEFPTFEEDVACFRSPEYGAVETIIVEGGEATPR